MVCDKCALLKMNVFLSDTRMWRPFDHGGLRALLVLKEVTRILLSRRSSSACQIVGGVSTCWNARCFAILQE
jgi:hypothetical protein